MRWWILLVGSLPAPAAVAAQPAAAPATVVVLGTRHFMHAEVPAQGNTTLGRAIDQLAPDVPCIELQPGDLAMRLRAEVNDEVIDTAFRARHALQVALLDRASAPVGRHGTATSWG